MTEQTIEQAEVEQEPTPAEQAEQHAADAALAADLAEQEQENARRHAGLAAEARQRDAALEVADEASATESAATRARAYAADAAESAESADRIRRLAYDLGQLAIEPSPGGDPDPEVDLTDEKSRIQAAYDQARDAASRASSSRYAAEGQAKQASFGVDWLRYHMDGHCKGWKARISA